MSSLTRTKLFSKNCNRLDMADQVRRIMKRKQRQYKYATVQYANQQRQKLKSETISKFHRTLSELQIVIEIDANLIDAIEKEKGFAIEGSQLWDDYFARWPVEATTSDNHFRLVICLDNSGNGSAPTVVDNDCPSVDDVLKFDHRNNMDTAGLKQQVRLWRGVVLGAGKADGEHRSVRIKLIDSKKHSTDRFSLLRSILDSKRTSEDQVEPEPTCKLILRPDMEQLFKRRHLIERAIRKFEHLKSCSLEVHKFLLGDFNDYRNQTASIYHRNDATIYADDSNHSNSSGVSSVATTTIAGKKAPHQHAGEMMPARDRLIDLIGIVQLHDLQRLAVRQSMRRRFSLIEGAAGSGKTVVAANLACQLSRLRRRKVLLCSPVQATVDRLASMISRTDGGLSVVQLPPIRADLLEPHLSMEHARLWSSKPNYNHYSSINKDLNQQTEHPSSNTLLSGELNHPSSSIASDCMLDRCVDRLIFEKALRKYQAFYKTRADPPPSEYLMWKRQRAKLGELAERSLEKSSWWLRKRMERKVIKEADIVCCTPEQAGSWLLNVIVFDALIIDDAQFVSELSSLVPLMLPRFKQVTLLSDVRRDIRLARTQPNATATNGKSARYPLGQSRSKSMDRLSNDVRKSRQINQRKTSLSSSQPRKTNANNKFRLDNFTNCDPTGNDGNLFERLLSRGLSTVALRYQYRMHDKLASFTNHYFYLDRLKIDPDVNEHLTHKLRFKTDRGDQASLDFDKKCLESEVNVADNNRSFDWLPDPTSTTALFDLKDCTTSLDNETIIDNVAQCMIHIVDNLVTKESVSSSDIIVVVNCNKLLISLRSKYETILLEKRIRVTTVDRFIGQEKDFVILIGIQEDALLKTRQTADNTCKVEYDFLQNDSALNIALTRARLGLFIVTSLNLVSSESSQMNEDSDKTKSVGEEQVNGDQSKAENDTENKSKKHKFDQNICKSWRKLVGYYNSHGLIAQKE